LPYLLSSATCENLVHNIDLVLNRARAHHNFAILVPIALVVESNHSCCASTLVGLSRGVDVGSFMNFVMCHELCICDVGLCVGSSMWRYCAMLDYVFDDAM
jgi:hypothetical protein